MDSFSAYDNAARSTAIYPGSERPNAADPTALSYLALGLCGESGEVADKIKKVIRDNGGVITDDVARAVLAELGDVLWYLSRLSAHLGSTLGKVAAGNAAKLSDRAARGALHGSGDTR